MSDENDSFLESSVESNEYKDSFVESDLRNGVPKANLPSEYTRNIGIFDDKSGSS